MAACREVGQRFAVGMNAPADPKRAEFYLFEACNTQSDAKACDYLASFYGANAPMAKRDQDKHQKYRQRACELDWAQACYAVGGYHFAFKRMEEAKAAHGKACDLGLTQSCAAIEE